MAQVQLYAKKQDAVSQFVNLELFEAEPIKLTLNVTNIEDPLAATSVYSKTFRVPHTSVNGPFFEGVFNVNSVDYDASKKADAYIMDNGILFTNGQITLNGIYVNEATKNIEYDITFLGETSDFGAKIGGGFLSELDLSKYNHDRTYTSITNSWTNGLFAGDIVYGLIEWGYTYNANNQPIEPTLSNGFQKSFTSSGNPLKLQQWKPQIRAKALWDTIFDEAGYTYDSTFLNSSIFKNMYVISDNNSSATIDTANTFKATNPGIYNDVVGATTTLSFTNEVSDPANNYNPNVSRYTAPATGTYEFVWTAEADILQNGVFLGGSMRVVNTSTNQVLGSGGYTLNSGYQNITVTANAYLTAGTTIRFENNIQNISGGGTGSTMIKYFDSTMECTNSPSIMAIAGLMPNNIRKIDYMRSIINRFRLVFVPSKSIANHFTITPWKDWILQGSTVDWSNKLDTSKDLKITPLFYGQSRFQVYKDQEDADYLNYNYQLTYKQTYGQYNLDSTNELIKGEKVYQDKFAPTPIAPIGFKNGDVSGSRFLVPHIAKDTGSTDDSVGTTVITGKREPIQPKLRLVFYNGLKTAPLTWYMADTLLGTSGVAKNNYPLMSTYSTFPVTSTTFDLNWENESPFWDVTDTNLGLGQTPYSNFNVYWKTWYDLMFDPFSRMVEANIVLDYKDIWNLKFNDYVFIKDAWYFVNKISDYIAGQNTNCRVELVKLGNNIGLTIPVVTPSLNTPILLCSADSACDAFCCNPAVINSTPIEYFLNGTTPQTSTALFIDSQGTQFAPGGIYSDGTDTFEVNGNGVITTFYNTDTCDCTEESYQYNLLYSTNSCGACCNGTEIVVYGNNAVFQSAGYLYLDSALTIPAPIGHYVLGTLLVQVGANGQMQQQGNCEYCQCTTYYPYNVCYAETECESCCCPSTVQVWGDNASFLDCNHLYLDNAGLTPAPIGWYRLTPTAILQISPAGNVDGIGQCAGCAPCAAKPVPVDVFVSKVPPAKTFRATLQQSIDNVTWEFIGEVVIEPTDPAGTTKIETFHVDENTYIRTIFVSDTTDGTLTTDYRIGADIIPYGIAVATPQSRTVAIPGLTQLTETYRFDGYVVRDTDCDPEIIIGGQFTTYKGTGFPPSNTQMNAIIGLLENGDVNTDFNVGDGGLKLPGGSAGLVWEIKKVGEQYLLSGQFSQYKNLDCTNGLVLLNQDGSIDENFNTSVGIQESSSPAGRWVDTHNGIAYIGGQFIYWDRAPLGSTTPDPYTASPKMVAINISDGTLNTGFNSQFWPATNVIIEVVKYHDGKLYVGGNMLLYGADTRRWLYRLNLDGTLDTSFNATHLGGNAEDLEFDGDYIWVGGTFSGGIKKILKSDGSAVTWGPTTKFNSSVTSFNLFGDQIYAVGNFTTYNGTSYNRIIALNKSDGSVYAPFTIGTGLNAQARNSQVTSTHIYVTGDFSLYNGDTVNRIVKISLTDGSRDTSFITGSAFASTTIGLLVTDCEIPQTLYPINTSNGTGACGTWCDTVYDTQVYGNGPSLIQSTQLFLNASGTTVAPPGFYSDGSTLVEVDGNGVIISVYDTALCPCGKPDLTPIETTFDADSICDAKCTGPTTTIYLNTPDIYTATIAYSNNTGSAFATPGYYIYLTNVITIGANGIITGITPLPGDCPCQTEVCGKYKITSVGNSQIIQSTWTDCLGQAVSVNNPIPIGGSIVTSCTLPSSISASGDITIEYVGPCEEPQDYYIALGQVLCRTIGTCGDNGYCGVKFPVLTNAPLGSTVTMIVNASADSTVTLQFEAGTYYVFYNEFNAVTSFANITLTLVNGGTIIGTTTSNITHGAYWSYLQSCTVAPCNSYTLATTAANGTGGTYLDCEGNPQEVRIGGVSGYDATTFCAIVDSVQYNGDCWLVENGPCGDNPPVVQYCYEGFWEVDDPQHPNGGTIVYINEFGTQTTINHIWLGDTINIFSSDVISTTGVSTIEC